VKNRLAGDLPVAQKRPDPREVAPVVLDHPRLQRTVGDQPGEQGKIGAEALLGLRGEVMKGLDAGVLVLGEIAEIERGRLARGIAVDDDRAARSGSGKIGTDVALRRRRPGNWANPWLQANRPGLWVGRLGRQGTENVRRRAVLFGSRCGSWLCFCWA